MQIRWRDLNLVKQISNFTSEAMGRALLKYLGRKTHSCIAFEWLKYRKIYLLLVTYYVWDYGSRNQFGFLWIKCGQGNRG